MGSNNFLIILFVIFFMNMITVGKGQSPPPTAPGGPGGPDDEEKDKPQTVWEFIYTDWKEHLDSNMVDLPDLYKLFIEGWMPEEPKDEQKKRSLQKTIDYELKGGNMKDLESFRNWINDFIEMRKYTRFIENNHLESERSSERNDLKAIEAHNNIELPNNNISVNDGGMKMDGDEEMQNQKELIDRKKRISNNSVDKTQRILEEKKISDEKETREEGKNTKEKEINPHKTMEEAPNDMLILNSKKIISTQQSFQKEKNELQGLKQYSIYSPKNSLQDRKIYHAKRSIVEEVETPTYCKFFGKCILASCDCSNLKQIF
ncbi:uncharacterized protein LOC123682379 [Harmonia axyridis]|uniref:uncharacterized protein LOC123682379 n=1 Tax=Harmonia axyridis TaxID=115357 RepID=UPI001E2761A4|nr:uncharacterized protein LOC123682379 [Harmonia axyridis]